MGFLDFLKPNQTTSSGRNTTSSNDYTPSISIHFDDFDDMEEEGPNIDLYKITDKQALSLQEYYVLDVETTGLDRTFDYIIEIAWIKVSNGEIVDSFSTLVNPGMPIPPAATRVNGIRDADVANAPRYYDIKNKVADALLESVVVGHNVQFDLAFIKSLLGDLEGRILYLDTVHYAKKAFPGMKNYKLGTLCRELSLCHQCTHRSLADVTATKELFDMCQSVLQKKDQEEKAEKQRLKKEAEEKRASRFSASPLFNVAFAFTGDFSRSREDMEALALSAGAVIRTRISSKTDYLVVGDLSNTPNVVTTNKLSKANEIIAKGGKIKKISESEFMDMIGAAKVDILKARSIQPTN